MYITNSTCHIMILVAVFFAIGCQVSHAKTVRIYVTPELEQDISPEAMEIAGKIECFNARSRVKYSADVKFLYDKEHELYYATLDIRDPNASYEKAAVSVSVSSSKHSVSGSGSKDVNLKADQGDIDVRMSIELKPFVHIKGAYQLTSVLSGEPVPHCVLAVSSDKEDLGNVTTDAEGKFEIDFGNKEYVYLQMLLNDHVHEKMLRKKLLASQVVQDDKKTPQKVYTEVPSIRIVFTRRGKGDEALLKGGIGYTLQRGDRQLYEDGTAVADGNAYIYKKGELESLWVIPEGNLGKYQLSHNVSTSDAEKVRVNDETYVQYKFELVERKKQDVTFHLKDSSGRLYNKEVLVRVRDSVGESHSVSTKGGKAIVQMTTGVSQVELSGPAIAKSAARILTTPEGETYSLSVRELVGLRVKYTFDEKAKYDKNKLRVGLVDPKSRKVTPGALQAKNSQDESALEYSWEQVPEGKYALVLGGRGEIHSITEIQVQANEENDLKFNVKPLSEFQLSLRITGESTGSFRIYADGIHYFDLQLLLARGDVTFREQDGVGSMDIKLAVPAGTYSLYYEPVHYLEKPVKLHEFTTKSEQLTKVGPLTVKDGILESQPQQ